MSGLSYPPSTAIRREFSWFGATDAEAEDTWHSLRAHAPGSTDRRVQRLQYNNWRGIYTSEVGYLEHDDVEEWITAGIFEPASSANPWQIVIVKAAGGSVVTRNPPILVASTDVLEITDFLP